MIEASCHCGAVRLAVGAAPGELNACQCSICRRYGAHWAYYDPSDVRFLSGEGETDVYMWNHRTLEFHRCRSCGCVTHWSPVDRGRRRMGVNARMMPPEVVDGIAVRRTPGPP
jgi:hypothetical protein